MKLHGQASIRLLLKWGAPVVVLLLSAVIMGHALSQVYTGSSEPVVYLLPTLPRVIHEAEALQELLSNKNQFSPVEFQLKLRALAAANKSGIRLQTVNNDHSLTTVETPTDPHVPPRSTAQSQSTADSSGDVPMEGVPSIGYTVGLYTYAGFEPTKYRAHLGVTDPKIAGKYALYRYLIDNKIDPNTNWARAAAEALNKQFGVEFYIGTGQHIKFGPHWVHSAPNGYGLSSYQYDSHAKGEFFWGYN